MPIETPTAEELNKHEIEHDLIDLDEHIEDIAKKVAKEKVDEIPHFLGGGGGVGGGGGTGGLDTEAGDARYLKLDQTTPQTITGGVPIGLEGSYTHKIIFNMIGTADEQAWVQVPYDCTITSYELTADQSGSIVIDLWKNTYTNFPPTVADSITASAKPTLSSAQKATDSTLTGWTKTISAGDYLLANVDSAATLEKAILIINVTRN